MINYKNKNGFTLIELLVVIAIIGMLSSVVLASLSSAREKSRDAKRLSDAREIQKALELYYHDNNSYPVRSWTHSDESGWNGLNTSLSPYLPELPVDPKNDRSHSGSGHGAYQYVYSYYSNSQISYGALGHWYMFTFRLENDNAIELSDGAPTCSRTNPNHVSRGASQIGIFHYGAASGTYKNVITVGPGCAKTY